MIHQCTGELEVKRLYLKGYTIERPCPHCKYLCAWDGDSEYVSYPKLGSPESVGFYCDTCDHDFEAKIVVNLTVTEVK